MVNMKTPARPGRPASTMKLFRTAVGMSQPELARLVGRAQSFVSDVENGRRIPIPSLAKKIAELLHSTPGELFGNLDAARAKKRSGDEARRG
jgi:transcriptional regulator with XRE-family HTH domain